MDMSKIFILIVLGGTSLAVGYAIMNEKPKLACVAGLKEKFEAIGTAKKVIQNADNGLLVLTPTSTSNTKIIGFLSPVQLKSLPDEVNKNGMRLLSLKETGKCTHEMSGFEYITFEAEYSDDTKQL
jgi:hypothetical protein